MRDQAAGEPKSFLEECFSAGVSPGECVEAQTVWAIAGAVWALFGESPYYGWVTRFSETDDAGRNEVLTIAEGLFEGLRSEATVEELRLIAHRARTRDLDEYELASYHQTFPETEDEDLASPPDWYLTFLDSLIRAASEIMQAIGIR